ncbi:MAG: septum formation initiator family protein [Faecalibacterium sp.]|nr:septum formation initiator family protein [Faecalibacterium sp.]
MARQIVQNKPKRGVPALLLRCVFLLVIISMLTAYISNQVTISSKRQQLEAVQAQLTAQQQANEELARVLEGDEDEINERIARDTYGYAAPNERVFVDISGK